MAVQTGGDLVIDALRLIAALAAGELPAGYEAQDGQMRLNDLLAEWETQQYQVFTIQNLSAALGAGVFAVTAGPSSLITTRPVKIETANSIRGGVTSPIEVINAARWARIRDKAATGKVPEFLYNDNANPVANLNIWPGTTDTLTTLDLWIWGEFSTLTTTLYTDLVIDAVNAYQVTSAANPFVAADVGNYINVPYGITGFTAGRYQINAVVAGKASLTFPGTATNAPIGTLGQTGGIASYDQGLALPPGFWKGIRYNLALDLAPEYGRADLATMKLITAIAQETKAEIRGLRQSNQSTSEAPAVPDQAPPQNPEPTV